MPNTYLTMVRADESWLMAKSCGEAGEELQMKARGIVNSYGQSHLSSLVRQGILTNNKYANPRGYGLTEWDK